MPISDALLQEGAASSWLFVPGASLLVAVHGRQSDQMCRVPVASDARFNL